MSETPSSPDPGPESALPSVGARVTAFVAILVGGAAGGLIGISFADLQCTEGSCDLSRGLWLWGCSILGAIGVAVVAVLTLRALGEWNTRTARAQS